MGIKISLKMAGFMFIMAFLSACGNAEKNGLRTENEVLRISAVSGAPK